jgi:alpha-beta hydrolase superfamily lysophospholipase
MSIISNTGHFTGVTAQLFWRAWLPSTPPKALLVLLHGFDDHSGRYQHVGDTFAQRGFAVYGFDLIGHGQSEGRRGYVARFDDYLEDVKRFVAIAQTKTPDVPTFLVGHSMGGLIALRYGILYPQELSGVITTGAALLLALPVPSWKIMLSKTLSQLVPTFTLPNDIPAQLLTHDQTIVNTRLNHQDPYTHYVATARWGAEFLAAQADTLAQAPRFSLPCLLMHGSADGIVSPDGTRRFHDACGSADKTIKIYDGFYHEVYNEIGKEQVFADVEQWLNQHVEKG